MFKSMMETTVYQEDRLISFSGLVGIVGGSLGLFLGFSGYGIFAEIVEKIIDFISFI